MYTDYATLTALYPIYASAPYTQPILDAMIAQIDAIVNSYICSPLYPTIKTVTKEVLYNDAGCGLIMLPDCKVNSIISVSVACNCNNPTDLVPCDYLASCEYGWVKICNWGGCTYVWNAQNETQCCATITYDTGYTPYPVDFMNAYYALFQKLAHCVQEDFNLSVGCTASDDIQPMSDKIASYNTEGESVTFYQGEMAKACADEGASLYKGWIERIFKRYRCCGDTGITHL